MKEEFKKIPGFPGYFVSNHGRIKFRKKIRNGEISERFMSIDKEKGTVRFTREGKSKAFTVARLVAEAFLEEESDGRKRVSHKDGDVLNNHISNLEWSGLCRKDIREIREKLEQDYSIAELARVYNTNGSHIRRIRDKLVWKEV
jgi:hypothetical protein